MQLCPNVHQHDSLSCGNHIYVSRPPEGAGVNMHEANDTMERVGTKLFLSETLSVTMFASATPLDTAGACVSESEGIFRHLRFQTSVEGLD